MDLLRVDTHDILESGAFLTNLEFAVAVRPFELPVQAVEIAARSKLLRHDQDAAGAQSRTNTRQQRQPVLNRQELQNVVQDHDLRVVDFHLANIGLHPVDTIVEPRKTAGVVEHRRRTVDGDDLAGVRSHGTQHGKRRRAERTAEVVAAPGIVQVPGRQESRQRNDGFVTRHRAPDHVRENRGDGLVEGEVDQLPRLVEQTVARRRRCRHGGRLFRRRHSAEHCMATEIAKPPNLASADLYINRELAQLEFIRRVLEQAKRDDVPLLERLRFLCIVGTILDEFFEIRVSGLKQQEEVGATQRGPDNLSPTEQLRRIAFVAHDMVDEQYRILNDVLFPLLDAEGIRFLKRAQWNRDQEAWLREFFHRELEPILTPIGLDPAHPFPRILNKNLTFIVTLEGKDAFGRKSGMAVVQAPRALPRVVRLPRDKADSPNAFVFLSSIIHAHVDELFPGMKAVGCYQFRVTRNSDLFVDEEAVDDLLIALEGELSSRRFGDAVRLELADDCPKHVGQFLADEFSVAEEDVYYCNGPVNLTRINTIPDLVDRPDLKYPGFTPSIPARIQAAPDIFSAIRSGDILLHHPFHSFVPVLDFLRSAAEDPNVLSIRQTLYRTGTDSAAVKILLDAARRGKEVLVVIELRARFDEAANIELANHLQEAGAQVVYGIVGHKTHAKMILVIRREDGELRRYAHLGTGNYHARTARGYTDFGLLTADVDMAADVQRLFHQLTTMGRSGGLNKLVQSPFTLHQTILRHIDVEIENATAGKPAGITAKMNQLIESDVIKALYRASQAGVCVQLVVRGICSLKPGIEGVSENISVRSIVGRFLEHTRIFLFENGGDRRIYLSSADWMGRNFFSRVETCFPIEDEVNRQAVVEQGLEPYLRDNAQAWVLQADGGYEPAACGEDRHCAQEELLELLTR